MHWQRSHEMPFLIVGNNQQKSRPLLLFFFMACSKLFSGDLPEVTDYIIRFLRNDLKSLYSCVLVNRLLFRITVPILWEDPFSIVCQEESPHDFLDTYFLFFDEDVKMKLKEF